MMSVEDVETQTIEDENPERKNVLMRGLWMLVLAVLFAVAETVLLIATVLQFGWMLFAREKNKFLIDFGKDLAAWLQKTARFQTGGTDEKPFPWTPWKS